MDRFSGRRQKPVHIVNNQFIIYKNGGKL